MRLPPVGAAGVAHAVNQQKGFQALLDAAQIFLGRAPSAHQIAERFVARVRDVHRGQIVHAQQPNQLLGIAPVGLDPIPRFLRDQRGRAHHVRESLRREVPMQPVPTGPGVVHESNLRRLRLHAGTQPVDVAVANPDLAQTLDLAQPDGVGRNDRILMHI